MGDETSGHGRVAIVTGAASGIGRATAALLERQGHRVARLDLRGVDIAVDVSDPEAVDAAVAEVRSSLGPVDVLVNAAGIAAGSPLDGDRLMETWDRAIAVNLTGTMLMARACLADLVREGTGRVVNIASTEGLTAARQMSPYTVSKHGVIGFTRSLAVEVGRSGATANAICPGATDTGMTAPIPDEHKAVYARRHIPTGRYGRPEEIAWMIGALVAPEASFVNGAIIPVDGGMTAAAR